MKEIINDSDGKKRIEIKTDGKFVHIGRDVDEGKCVTWRYENGRNLIDRLKAADTCHSFETEVEHFTTRFLLWRGSFNEYRFFKDDELVLKINDHEGGPLYAAQELADQYRAEKYDYAEIVRQYIESIMTITEEIDELSVGPHRSSVSVRSERSMLDEHHIEELKSKTPIDWRHIAIDDGQFVYKFNVDTRKLL